MKLKGYSYFLWSSVLSLLLGSMVYVLFRPEYLIVFDWVRFIGLIDEVRLLRVNLGFFTKYLPNWFIYNLPNGLWCYSYVCCVYVIWKKLNLKVVLLMLIIPLLGVFTELMQLYHWILGIYDGIDILFYVFGFFAPVIQIFFKTRLSLKNENAHFK